jgi:hypothetical protein
LIFGGRCAVAARNVFSADELAQLRGFPEVGRAELLRFFMLTSGDEEFVRRFRDKRNVLGAAVQLCTLPWLGFVPKTCPRPDRGGGAAVGEAGHSGWRAAGLRCPRADPF